MEEIENRIRKFIPIDTQVQFLRDYHTPIISFMSAVNQGKSASLPAKGMYNARMQHPDEHGNRHTAIPIIRGTQSQLLDTTVKAVREWISEDLMPIRRSQPIEGFIRDMPANDHLKDPNTGQYPTFPQTMRYRDNMGREIEAPYLIGATKNPDTGLYEGGLDASGQIIADVFPKGTLIQSHWRFMALDSLTWEGDLLSTNFSFAMIDEADQIDDLEEKLPVIAGRLGRYPSADVAPCTSSQIAMCYNPPDMGSFLEKFHRPQYASQGRAIYRVPAPLIKVDNPEDPDDYINCTYKVNPDAEGLHFAADGAYFWLQKAEQFKGDEHYIERSLLGNYPRTSGSGKRIYTRFDARKHVKEIKASRRLKLIASLDWGNTPCMSVLQWDIGLRVFDELYDDDMLAPTFIKDEVIPFLKSKYSGYDIVVTGDPTGSTVTGASTESLFDLFAPDYPTVENLTNDKHLRWDAVSHYLSQEGGFLIDPSCERLIEGFESGYVFDPLAAKRGQKKAQKHGPKGTFSHIHDALQAGALYFRGGHEYRAEQIQHHGGRHKETKTSYLRV